MKSVVDFSRDMSSLGTGKVVSLVTEALRHKRTGEWQYSALHSKPQYHMQVVSFTFRPIYTRENSSQRLLVEGLVGLRSGLEALEKIKALAPASHVISSRFAGTSHVRSIQRSEGELSRKVEIQNIEVHEHTSLLHVFLNMKVFRDVTLSTGTIPVDLNLQ